MNFYQDIIDSLYVWNTTKGDTNFADPYAFIEAKHFESNDKDFIFYERLLHEMPNHFDPLMRSDLLKEIILYCNRKIDSYKSDYEQPDFIYSISGEPLFFEIKNDKVGQALKPNEKCRKERTLDILNYAIVSIEGKVEQYQQVKQLISQVPKDIDFMVSCVGVGFYAPLDADYSEAWKNMFETNVVCNINVLSNVTSLLPQCKKIIVLGSVASKRPSDTPGNSVYRASKVALATFLSDYRRELRAKGHETKICNIEPGFIEGTDFGRRFFETNPEKHTNLYQSFKSLTAADVAGVIFDVLRQDDNLDIGELVVRPVGQPT